MAEIDWTTFAQGLDEYFRGVQSDITQRETEKRMEAQQYRMAREMQDISLEGLSKKLDIEEPSKIRAEKRLLENNRMLAEEADQRQRASIEWGEDRNKKLNIFAGSEGWADAIERARKGKDLSEVEIMKMEDAILRAKAGEAVDPSAFEALKPFDRLPLMELLNENNRRVEEHQRIMGGIQRNITQNEELISYRKQQERIAAEREERLGVSAEQMNIKRWAEMRSKLDTDVEKAATTFDKYRTELFTELEDTNKINAKGEAFATIGGKKKIKLIDPDTGELNEKAVEKFVGKYTRYRGRFKRLKELRGHVETRNQRRDEFFGGEPAGAGAEIEVPEEEIRAAMEMGLTREQAVEQYRKFLATKR